MATLDEQMWQGDKAKEVLENPTFQWAFNTIEQELITAWADSPSRDSEGREKIFLSLQITRKLKATITNAMETGRLAGLEKLHQQNVAERIRGMLP